MPKPTDDPEDGPKVYKLPHPDTGEIMELPRVTAVIGKASKFPLERWKRHVVAQNIASDETLRMLALSNPWQASDEALRRGPLRGTAVHGLTEMIDAGADIEMMTVDMAKMTNVYKELMQGLQILHTEITLVNFSKGYCGTTDKILGYDDGNVIADVKTSKGVYADVAMQLAAYANAEAVWTGDAYEDMPKVRNDVGLVINLRIDGGDLVPVHILDAYQAFLGMLQFSQWQDGDGKKAVQKPIRSYKVPVQEPRPSPPSNVDLIMGDKSEPIVTPPKIAELMEELEKKVNEKRAEGYVTVPADPRKPSDVITMEKPAEMTAPKIGNTIAEEVILNKWKALQERALIGMKDNKAAVTALQLQWPEGVPKFKAVREGQAQPTADDIARLSVVIDRVEEKHCAPFRKAVEPEQQTFPLDTAVLPVVVSEFELAAIKNDASMWQLQHPHHAVHIAMFIQEAKAVGKSLVMTTEKRSIVIVEALKAFGEAVDHKDYKEIIRQAISFVVGFETPKAMPIGAELTSLTFEQAQELLEVGLAIGNGFVLQFSDDGEPILAQQ